MKQFCELPILSYLEYLEITYVKSAHIDGHFKTYLSFN